MIRDVRTALIGEIAAYRVQATAGSKRMGPEPVRAMNGQVRWAVGLIGGIRAVIHAIERFAS